MKRVLALVTALLLTTAGFAQQATDPAQDPSALGNAFFKAMLNEDGGTIGKLITSDFIITSFDGQMVDGDLLQQGLNGGYAVFETGVVSDASTRQYNADSAVMTGTWKVKGTIQSNPLDANAAFSVVCVKQGGLWKVAHVQFTPAR